MADVTWQPPEHPEQIPGRITNASRRMLPETAFAFPKRRQLPLTNKRHVITGIAMMCRVTEATDEEREQAFENIKKAGDYYQQPVQYGSWKDLCTGIQARR